MKGIRYTQHRINALITLARFEYLTTDQFLRLGVSSSKSNLIKRVLKPFREASPPFVEHYNRGRGNDGLYCLTKHGAEIAAKKMERSLKSIRYPINGIQHERDFEHRRGTIDFLIELFLYCQKHSLSLDFVRTYYQGTGAQRSRNKFRSDTLHILFDGRKIEPDLLFRFTMKDKESRLMAFEFHRGIDTGRIVEQLVQHAQAISEGIFSDRFDHPDYNFVLSVCENPKALENTLKRLRKIEDFDAFSQGFLFSTLDTLKENFAQSWIKLDGTRYSFF